MLWPFSFGQFRVTVALMIVLFSDFGLEGPYIGQVKAVLHSKAPQVTVIDLFADAPAFDPQLGAYLLAAYAEGFPAGTVFLAVVDPGVGSDRPCVALKAGEHWFVGPGNGLFEIVARRAEERGDGVAWHVLTEIPETASPSFHGRDVFAPLAAHIHVTGSVPKTCHEALAGTLRHPDWPDDLAKVVYIDVFGNAMTGLRAAKMGGGPELFFDGKALRPAKTFSDVPLGDCFCYENANGLVEIAANSARASEKLGINLGDNVQVVDYPG